MAKMRFFWPEHGPLALSACAIASRRIAARSSAISSACGASFEEHAVIVEALLAHDVTTCHREMRAHLLSARGAATRMSPAWAECAPL
jgi:DNA-binding GntR family transcriptional regulator